MEIYIGKKQAERPQVEQQLELLEIQITPLTKKSWTFHP